MSKNPPPPYSPAPPGFVPPPTENINITMATQPIALGPGPTTLTCPHCHARVTTTVKTTANTKTHIIALILCLFVLVPCVCIPYCCDSCQTLQHFCPNCKAYLGAYDN
ncbi:unnamed protein product [Acanthoscelides obtectus]|uniref:LITAF domain-containing protein n=2 Tax=Acanthoscelides obtectus TaxID=200917 RepID=A0A9P0K894_ACAOB|nr:unnamed protein product [Acanthoscelides obtectus]CAK1622900.1 Lipopolysaccharide-induced tumor necrosis factor-alpha factor homolog [Acanthoscelides obtectus]